MAFASTFAQKLRAIGQAMEGAHFEDFDIESNGNSFFIRGIIRSKPESVSFLRALLGKSPTQDARFREFRYTSDEIERLEKEGQARRRDPDGMPDFYTLSQMLRTVGAYIDGKRARLGKLYRRGTRLILEFEGTQVPPSIEEHTVSSFYNFFVHMYLRRSGHPAKR
jgi:hypothetical protein